MRKVAQPEPQPGLEEKQQAAKQLRVEHEAAAEALAADIVKMKADQKGQERAPAVSLSSANSLPTVVEAVVADITTRASERYEQTGALAQPLDGVDAEKALHDAIVDMLFASQQRIMERSLAAAEQPTREQALAAIGEKCQACASSVNTTPEDCPSEGCPLHAFRTGLALLLWFTEGDT